ncbi:MAG: GNAT family N-acetyltransferase [Pseudomonadota bacterium]
MGEIDRKSGFDAPTLLSKKYELSDFDCGEPVLNDWLKKRALKNNETGASRTYVLAKSKKVVAYYALSVGSIAANETIGRFRRNMPDPIPVMVLARLAITQEHQGQGLGRALVRDALLRTIQAADIAGIRGVIVHALNDDARTFYEALGFSKSPVQDGTLMVTLNDIKSVQRI